MPNIRFFSKVAFICNLCFVMAIVIQWVPRPLHGELIATTVILGYIFAAVVNLIVSLWIIIIFFSGRRSQMGVPAWLIVANFLFLAPELILLLR